MGALEEPPLEWSRGWLPPDLSRTDDDTAPVSGPLARACAALRRSWRRSDWLFQTFFADGEPAARPLLVKPIRLRHPFLFYLGHLPAFAHNRLQVVCGKEYRVAPLPRTLTTAQLQELDVLFERGMDPDVDDPTRCHRHSEVPDAAEDWPSVTMVAAYRDYVRQQMVQQLERVAAAGDITTPTPTTASKEPWLRLAWMVVEHELMHIETLCYMLQQTDARWKKQLEWKAEERDGIGHGAETTPQQRHSFVPIGACATGPSRTAVTLGCNPPTHAPTRPDPISPPFLWDNEMPQVVRSVRVPYLMAVYPVTNGEYLRFVQAGGYRQVDAFWDAPSDAPWLARERLLWPRCWRAHPHAGQRNGAGSMDAVPALYALRIDGTLVPYPLGDARCVANDWPVYVSLAEARAYVRWHTRECARRGRCRHRFRLPTEDEWQLAADGIRYPDADAEGNGAEPSEGNYHWGRLSPVSVRASDNPSRYGVHDLLGNGWEWTDTVFAPLDARRFTPTDMYPEYSQDFFDGKHYVMRGASWATDRQLVRPSFRNWYHARYPYAFAKFRLVCDTACEGGDACGQVVAHAPNAKGRVY
ncbi:hypothetical protein CDCA_CDCA09G2657 [Cyanidium caldarium]|uniref:Sulfatase-modifying factor enzyme domain-containing protein n=1 Tax=Cyanidium caldarium TaxID=2771 RepID=A0AAV9IWI9_CYACA|nr:hypothetical protein CDCA_CDCA09G2657 [Cyanidium caldarium]